MRLRFAIAAVAIGIITFVGCSSFKSKRSKNAVAESPSQLLSPTEAEPEVTEMDPTQQRISLLYAKASLAEIDERRADAAKCYESILELDPENLTANHRLAILQVQLGNVDEADKYFRKALSLADKNPVLHNDYGYFRHLCDDAEEAERHLARAIELEPDYLAAHNNLGLVLAAEGRLDEAERHYRLAKCSRAESLNNLAFARFLKADLQGASALYKQAIKADPNQELVQRSFNSVERLAQSEPAQADHEDSRPPLIQTSYSTSGLMGEASRTPTSNR